MTTARQSAAALEIADDLDRIHDELIELEGDASCQNLHRAFERIGRMRASMRTTAKGLRIQAAKQTARAQRTQPVDRIDPASFRITPGIFSNHPRPSA